MDPTRFDALTKALAQTASRRRLLQGMAGSIVAGLLGRVPGAGAQPAPCPLGFDPCGDTCFDWSTNRQHCGGCDRPCGIGESCFEGRCTRAICTTESIDCWGKDVNPRVDPRNCGQCGEICATDKACVECSCEEPELLGGDVCRSGQLRLWMNAFLPGFGTTGAETVTVDGVQRTIVPVDTLAGGPVVLLADRDPDLSFTEVPFSPEANASAIARFELEVKLSGMSFTEPDIGGGAIVQLQETAPDSGVYTTLCTQPLRTPLSTCIRQESFTTSLTTFKVDCSWSMPEDLACGFMVAPIRIKGDLAIERLDAPGLVEIRFTEFDEPERNVRVSRFPALEMYARLDDGNQTAVFRRSPDAGWTDTALVEVEDTIGQQCGEEACPGVVVRLACGCGIGCENGKECTVTPTGGQQCRSLDAYYVLTGTAFQPTNDIVCADPRCPADAACTDPCRKGYFQADGPLTVTVDGRMVYSSDPFGREAVPPIGFRASPGARVRVFGPVTSRNRSILPYLSLHRVDGPYGRLVSEKRPDSGNKVIGSADGQTGIEIEIQQPRSTLGSTICCRDQEQQVCVDRMLSIEHCGGCNQSCPDGMICLAGSCICPHPWIAVGDTCIDPTQDPRKCGPNLVNCNEATEFCAQSSCVSVDCRDTSRFQVCDGQCVSLEDANHCGYNCESCRVPQNGRALCTGGACDFDCFDGFVPCGFECVDPGQAEHCGKQCLVCPGKFNATATCTFDDEQQDFVCGYRCNDDFHDCNGDCFWNQADATCGLNCEPCPPERPTCVQGECCWAGATICPTGCTDTWNDQNNCGGCGTFCNPGFCCSGGACVSIAASCGECGVFCGSGQFCIDGFCQDPGPIPDKECTGCTIPDNLGGCMPVPCKS